MFFRCPALFIHIFTTADGEKLLLELAAMFSAAQE
jgi:hypothetical protein